MIDRTSTEAHHPERIVPHWFVVQGTLKRIVNVFECRESALLATLVVVGIFDGVSHGHHRRFILPRTLCQHVRYNKASLRYEQIKVLVAFAGSCAFVSVRNVVRETRLVWARALLYQLIKGRLHL